MKTNLFTSASLCLAACVSLVALACIPSHAAPKHAAAPATPAMGHPNTQLTGKELDRKVEAMLQQMTLAEKAGQLAQYTYGFATGPGTHRENYDVMVEKGDVGSLLNVNNAATANHYQHVAMEKARLHIPLLFGLDVVHGDRTIFPVPLGMAASFDAPLTEQTAHVAAVESRADGVNWVFSPMVDIARDARWGRIIEGAGEDQVLGSAMARAYVRGYQGKDLSSPDAVAACVKHFAAYGAPVAGRDYNAVDMSENQLRQTYLPTYKAAIDTGDGAGAATVMSSFNSLNGVPSTANPFTLTQILRKEWGFDGLVVSDYGAVAELLKHGIAADGAAAADKAVAAGVDMDMEGDLYRTRIPALVQGGQLPIAVVDEAVRRILRVKYAMGLFDHPYAPENAPAYTATEEKRALARKAAEESLVLLKNEPLEGSGALLPLHAGGNKTMHVALIGPLADSKHDMLGSWAASGNANDAITLREALAKRLPGDAVTYVKGTDALGTSDQGFAEAVAAAKKSDVALLALGELADDTGEASSRTRLSLPGNQEQLLEAVAATGKPVVLILFGGRPPAIPWASAHVPAIVEAWFPGIEAGSAITDALFGKSVDGSEVNFSGKLPVEFPQSVGQEPLYLEQLPTGRPAGDIDLSHPPTNTEERYLSRYIDETNAPVYPFGWGLSYSRFTYSKPEVNHTMGSSNEVGKVEVSVDVKNTSGVAGAEVVQLYVRDMVASIEQPVRELKGFQRITLAPGEQKHISFSLGFDDLAFYNAGLKRVVEPGTFKVWVGGNSASMNEAEFTVLQ